LAGLACWYGDGRGGERPAGGCGRAQGEGDPGGLALAIISVVAAIPVTAIAAEVTGLPGMIVSWAGLVGINLARNTRRNPR
jgi:hypothetical protein